MPTKYTKRMRFFRVFSCVSWAYLCTMSVLHVSRQRFLPPTKFDWTLALGGGLVWRKRRLTGNWATRHKFMKKTVNLNYPEQVKSFSMYKQ